MRDIDSSDEVNVGSFAILYFVLLEFYGISSIFLRVIQPYRTYLSFLAATFGIVSYISHIQSFGNIAYCIGEGESIRGMHWIFFLVMRIIPPEH